MNLIRYEYPSFTSFDDLFERFFDNCAGRSGSAAASEGDRAFRPATNFEEDDNAYYATVELPGVDKNDVSIDLDNAVLSIKASRTEKSKDSQRTVRFARSLSVPDGVKADKIEAKLENGLLSVTLPKAEETRPRAISVA